MALHLADADSCSARCGTVHRCRCSAVVLGARPERLRQHHVLGLQVRVDDAAAPVDVIQPHQHLFQAKLQWLALMQEYELGSWKNKAKLAQAWASELCAHEQDMPGIDLMC